MKISIIGTGYVGLTTGTCFAETGNVVTCIDCDAMKVARLNEGECPIYEPGLEEMIARNYNAGRLIFTTKLDSIKEADCVFIAVGTPTNEKGEANMEFVWRVLTEIAPYLSCGSIVVMKSTVPVGTNTETIRRLKDLTGKHIAVVSNPEFLKEGMAIDDCMKPDRVVVGTRQEHVLPILEQLYSPYLRTGKPFLAMSPESAEMTKYVANCFLATKISFINEMANICERLGANINEVRQGIGFDNRIGFSFLFPGVGYGGSCFPKDVQALISMAIETGINPRILSAVKTRNDHQKLRLFGMFREHFGSLAGLNVAIWGLSFKPGTDDIREAPSLKLIDSLLECGCEVRVHDPVANENVAKIYGDRLVYFQNPMNALKGADALAIVTEWKSFANPDFQQMRDAMRGRVIFDGRNIFNPDQMAQEGFTYYSIGQK